jgi:hypothetical protein
VAEKTFSREELYDLVWSEPITAIAKRLGLSGRGLAKACDRGNVSVPWRGYWQKLAAGQAPERVGLPPIAKGVPASVSVSVWPPEEAAFAVDANLDAEIASEATPDFAIVVPAPGKLHPTAQSVLDALSSERPDRHGAVSCKVNHLPSIRVMPSTVARAVRILDALMKGVDRRGWKVEGTHVVVSGIEHWFEIEERIKRVAHVATAKERAAQERHQRKATWDSYAWVPEWDYVSSNELTLKIYGGSYQSKLPRNFRDTSRGSLETRLNEVMIGVRRLAAASAAYRSEEAERERQRIARELEANAEHTRRETERALTASLLKDVSSWRLAEDIRAYVSQAASVRGYGEPIDRITFEPWARWAKAYANSIDPLRLKPWRVNVPTPHPATADDADDDDSS